MAYSNYTILLKGTDEDVKSGLDVISENISEISGKYSIEGGMRLRIEENYDYIYGEDLAGVVAEVVKVVPNVNINIVGNVDDSESSGEYMDFEVNYDGEKLTFAESCWYVEVMMDMYDSYEEFSARYRKVTKDEYEELKCHSEVFGLQSGDGEFVTKVPLDEPKVIEVK